MKYILIIILFLFPLLASAQPRVKTSETSSLRRGVNPLKGDSVWYEIRRIEYDNGSSSTVEEALRDTAEVVRFLTVKVIDNLKLSTFYVNQLWQAETAKAHAKQAENLLEVFGTSISKESITQYDAQFDSTAWQVTVNGGQPQPATMVANGTGKRLLLRVAGGSPIQVFLVGDTRMILLNYPSQGREVDVFRVFGDEFEFRDLTQSIKLKKL